MSYAPFDVVVVPFPYSDRLTEKRRPALVVSSQDMDARLSRVWVAMITSAVGKPGFGDHVLQDLLSAGLSSPSIVRASKLATLEKDRILRRAGSLSSVEIAEVKTLLAACSAFS